MASTEQVNRSPGIKPYLSTFAVVLVVSMEATAAGPDDEAGGTDLALYVGEEPFAFSTAGVYVDHGEAIPRASHAGEAFGAAPFHNELVARAKPHSIVVADGRSLAIVRAKRECSNS